MKTTIPIFPKPIAALKLITTGVTVGPLVDSLHNQCLLEYDKAAIDIPSAGAPFWSTLLSQASQASQAVDNDQMQYLIRTSWYIPPLLGIAYIVLGAILPRIMTLFLDNIKNNVGDGIANSSTPSAPPVLRLRNKAILAVASTAFIIKLSEYLETSTVLNSSEINLSIMITAAIAQWALLDATLPALLTAIIVAIGGPLSELPFVAGGYWHYIPSAADYFPLKDIDFGLLNNLLGGGYRDLALSSITGPCYFAVTMDAIALGRWFDAEEEGNE